MRLRTYISSFFRWIITWPIIIIIGLNIENLATIRGIANVFPENWTWLISVLSSIHSFATSNWVFYPAIFISGCIFYEWVLYTSLKLEKRNSKYRVWVMKNYADTIARSFLNEGYFSRLSFNDGSIELLNGRLEEMEMPIVPSNRSQSDELNKVYSNYLNIVGKGDFEFAKVFLESMHDHIRLESEKLQMLQDNETD